MKPKWADAPEWANFLVMDGDETWWWAEVSPELYDGAGGWLHSNTGRWCRADDSDRHWMDTLEERPK